MTRFFGSPGAGKFSLLVDTRQWAIGCQVRRTTLGATVWQLGLLFLCLTITYTTKSKEAQ